MKRQLSSLNILNLILLNSNITWTATKLIKVPKELNKFEEEEDSSLFSNSFFSSSTFIKLLFWISIQISFILIIVLFTIYDLGNLKNIFPNLMLLIMNWKLFWNFLLRKSNFIEVLLISHCSVFFIVSINSWRL